MGGDVKTGRWHQLTDWRFLVSLVGLVVNDRWGKQAYPGVLTGKVSDFVGMVILPVVLVTLVGLCPPLAIRLGERRSHRIALGFSGCLLVAIKTSATSARVVEASLQHLTGLEHAIVVDPTDVIGVLGLLVAHRVLHRARAIDLGRLRQIAGKAAFGVGLLACAATSYDDDAGWTRLEVQDEDRIVASGPDRASIVSRGGGRTWSAAGSDRDALVAETTTDGLVCLEREPNRCVRTTQTDDLTLIEESPDGGYSWTPVLTSERTAPWVTNQFSYNATIHFDDILWLEDDTVLVSAAHLEPVRRDPDTGQWSPTMAEVKRVPKGFLAVALVFAFPFLGAVRRFRARSAEGVAWVAGGLVAGYAAIVAALDSTGPGVMMGASIAGLVLLVLSAMAEARWKKSGCPSSRPPVIVAALGLTMVVSTPFVLFAQDLLSWGVALRATQIAVPAGALAAGFIGTPVSRRLTSPSPAVGVPTSRALNPVTLMRWAATPLVATVMVILVGWFSLGLLTSEPVGVLGVYTLASVWWIRYVSVRSVPGPPRSILILAVVATVVSVAVTAAAYLLVDGFSFVLAFAIPPVVMTHGRRLAEERFGLSRLSE